MPTAFRLLTVAVVAALASLLAVPAQAADPLYCWTSHCHATDPRGDAPAKADILGLRATQGKHGFTMSLRVRKLPAVGRVVFGAGTGGWGSNFIIKKRKHGYAVTEVTISEVEVYPASRCRSATVRWNRRTDVVHARFPISCTGSRGETIINGVDLRSGKAKDSIGHVFYGV